ncbi:MAG: Oligopeptide transport system permease protein OppC [candidate division BRC1 bacterium ADurb.BinA364]|nr:MAG: Oligopeptide transport system permease protein OppC [candidate division BRC1 bacterium ADurb.BinA364]
MTESSVFAHPPESPARLAWRRFRRHRLAMAGTAIVLLLGVAAAAGPWAWKYDYKSQDFERQLKPPSLEHPFGTDRLGRDLFVRVLHGLRISLAVGLAASLISLLVGAPYGAIAGYAGGRLDNAMMRLVDALYAIPLILFVILLMMIFERGLHNVFIALGLVYWLGMARMVRGEVLRIKQLDYVRAARGLGASPARLIFRHILPNAAGPISVTLTFNIPEAIFTESFLSFIGLGVSAPRASLGALASDGIELLRAAPWVPLFPALGISLLMLGFNFIGDGLRDALDPNAR